MTRLSSIDSTRNVDHAYDQFLVAHEKDAIAAITQFQVLLKKSDVRFGRFPIPSFLKAHFIQTKQEKLIKSVSDFFNSILNTTTALYFSEPSFKNQFDFSKEVEELLAIDSGLSRNVVIFRLDGFLEGEALKWIELNCDSPSGMGYGDTLEEMFVGTGLLKDFFDEYPCKHEERGKRVLSALLSAYEEFGGYENPNIAIMDWRTVRTKPELLVLKKIFEDKGYKTTVVDPSELKYKSGKLYHGNFKIDLIYRRVATPELADRAEEVQEFIKAYRDRAVCLVNPLRSHIASSKAVLSILTNPAYDRFFSARENEQKSEHLPWTRRVFDAESFYGGKKSYLIDFLKDEKDSLVLKPQQSVGGRDVMVGPETTDEHWNVAIDRALKDNWLIQELVSQPKITVPVVINNKLDFEYKKVGISVFVADGKYAGGLSRLSEETVINLAKGGGLIPVVTAEGVINR